MFKTMDGVSVYDKQDVDGITDAINTDVSQNTSDITNLKTGVHNLQEQAVSKSELNAKANTADLTETNTRVSNLENNKADKSEVSSLVQNTIDSVITAKINTIASDINHVVDNAVDDALENYDDSNTVDSKINTAIANIPAGPTAMTTAEATALINQYL